MEGQLQLSCLRLHSQDTRQLQQWLCDLLEAELVSVESDGFRVSLQGLLIDVCHGHPEKNQQLNFQVKNSDWINEMQQRLTFLAHRDESMNYQWNDALKTLELVDADHRKWSFSLH